MRVEKKYLFKGSVRRTQGVLKRRVVDKPIEVMLEFIGEDDNFRVIINRIFRLNAEVLKMPYKYKFKKKSALKMEDYPFMVEARTVVKSFDTKKYVFRFSFDIRDWSKLSDFRAYYSPRGWWQKWLLREIEVEGEAVLVSSKDIPKPDKPKFR